jgi:hypothetical protein
MEQEPTNHNVSPNLELLRLNLRSKMMQRNVFSPLINKKMMIHYSFNHRKDRKKEEQIKKE